MRYVMAIVLAWIVVIFAVRYLDQGGSAYDAAREKEHVADTLESLARQVRTGRSLEEVATLIEYQANELRKPPEQLWEALPETR
ncbi:MAG TPA: hypothetical protein VGM98_04750 [Schlesneria sp.]